MKATVQCIEKLTKYLQYACEPLPHTKPRDVLARSLVSELVWYLATEV